MIPYEIEQTVFELFCRFYSKFGRAPGANELVFFDPDLDEPTSLRKVAANEMWNRLADAMVCRRNGPGDRLRHETNRLSGHS